MHVSPYLLGSVSVSVCMSAGKYIGQCIHDVADRSSVTGLVVLCVSSIERTAGASRSARVTEHANACASC